MASVDIEDRPQLGAQGRHVRPAAAGATSVVDVEDGKATGGKKLIGRFKAGLDLAGGAAVDHDNQRRSALAGKAATGWGIVQPVDLRGVFAGPGNRLGRREIVGGKRLAGRASADGYLAGCTGDDASGGRAGCGNAGQALAARGRSELFDVGVLGQCLDLGDCSTGKVKRVR